MKKLLFALSLYTSIDANSQDHQQYFEGSNNNIDIVFIPGDSTNSWEVGKPEKEIFDSASTLPNAILTKLDTTYPINDTSSFLINPNYDWNPYGVHAIQWMQKLDIDSNDICIIEFSSDSVEWSNAFDNPYVYNFYGFDSLNVDTLKSIDSLTEDLIGFSGTDTVWRNIWLCFDQSYFSQIYARFKIISDSVDTYQEGWMMDNLFAHETFVHTVSEQQKEYLKIYPTITNGRVNIQTKKLDKYHIIESIYVYNINGEIVKSIKNVPTKFFINIDDLEKGQYFIKIKTNIRTETHKVVLK